MLVRPADRRDQLLSREPASSLDGRVTPQQARHPSHRPQQRNTHLASDRDGSALVVLGEGDGAGDLGVTLENSDSLESTKRHIRADEALR